ncbi:MAG: hypothetical protein ACTSUF_10655 [Candidatus Heimdallarchaeaceae archaeon]
MVISPREFLDAKKYYPSLTAVKIVKTAIHVVSANIPGIVGGRRKSKQIYKILVDLRSFPRELPTVYVMAPPDRQIRHVNIFHPKYCPITGTSLPYLCPGILNTYWSNTPLKYRNLTSFLRAIHELLSNENHASPAR